MSMNGRHGILRGAALSMLALCVACVIACSTTSGKMAGEGAKTGAAAGAVGGLVSALIFGGDPVEAAARGAVFGASAGATAGAMQGARVDEQREAQQKAQQDVDLEQLKREIGGDAYAGLEALTDCKHEVALAYGQTAARSKNRDHALAGLWVQVLTEADRRQEAQARALFPEIVAADSQIGSEAEAEEAMRETLQGLMSIRAEYGLQRVCST